MRSRISTAGRITILLGKYQATTGERMSPRKLAEKAGVAKDFVYRLDSGLARHVDLDSRRVYATFFSVTCRIYL